MASVLSGYCFIFSKTILLEWSLKRKVSIKYCFNSIDSGLNNLKSVSKRIIGLTPQSPLLQRGGSGNRITFFFHIDISSPLLHSTNLHYFTQTELPESLRQNGHRPQLSFSLSNPPSTSSG